MIAAGCACTNRLEVDGLWLKTWKEAFSVFYPHPGCSFELNLNRAVLPP